MKYCIWNNKGGVGKSFLTFCIATEYAIQHQDELVVVADLCPQSNITEMLLGGNGIGQENQSKLYELGSTIVGYIKERYLSRKGLEMIGTELKYFVEVNKYNKSVPSNMFLLPGDVELDLASVLVSEIEKSSLREAPRRAMSILKDILSTFEEANKNKKVTIFIDCNPSFAIYTELAIFASDRLIVPCTADFASLRGVNNVLKILYNYCRKDEKDSMFNIINFSEKALHLKLDLPTLYLGIINKARTYDTKATVAYNAHVDKIKACFNELENPVPVESIKDCNNISLVANYTGIPISNLEHKKYNIYGRYTQVNESQLTPIRDDINNVIRALQW